MGYLLSKSIELAKQVDEEAYEVFLEYKQKLKETEFNRLIEEGFISKEEQLKCNNKIKKKPILVNRLII